MPSSSIMCTLVRHGNSQSAPGLLSLGGCSDLMHKKLRTTEGAFPPSSQLKQKNNALFLSNGDDGAYCEWGACCASRLHSIHCPCVAGTQGQAATAENLIVASLLVYAHRLNQIKVTSGSDRCPFMRGYSKARKGRPRSGPERQTWGPSEQTSQKGHKETANRESTASH